MNLRLIITLTAFVSLCNGYKILFLAPVVGKSHFLFMQSIVRALLDRGHEVTYLTSNSLQHLNLTNYTEYLVDPPFDFDTIVPPDKLFNTAGSEFSTIQNLMGLTNIWNLHNIGSIGSQKLINSTEQFDVMINEEFFSDSFLMFAHKFKVPIVTICTFGYPDFVAYSQGLLTPLTSHVPHWTLPYNDKMSFSQRFYNTIVSIYDWYVRNYVYLPKEEEYAQKFFGHLGPLPSLRDLMLNISMVLVNTHRSIFPPRPTMPSIVSIGGAHLKPPKPLPTDIQKFIDESKHGVIYFSLGTIIKTSALPKEKLQIFLDAFKSLKQRVLWKFEDESLTDIPSNVMIRKWMPQNDIFAHPNVILFIGHGGLFGTTESLYHGIPLLLIPFFTDQHRNAHRVEMEGHGKFLSFEEMTKESLSEKINEIISNESFMNRAKQTSAVFKDNLVHPMDEAVFWIEHVAKFKGAKHFASHAVHMSWFSYLLLDIIFVSLLGPAVALYTLYYLLKKIFLKKKVTQNGKKNIQNGLKNTQNGKKKQQ